MENQDQNIKTENEQIIPKTKPKKRKKKTVSDIEIQIKELQKLLNNSYFDFKLSETA